MITKVRLPKISANVEEETVTAWLKHEGEMVRKGEPLLEVTTDKACVEVESPRSGVVRRILVKERSILPVGFIVVLIGPSGEPLPDVQEENAALLAKRRRDAGKRKRTADSTDARPRARVRATPAARRRARELDVALEDIAKAVGADVVTEAMVQAFAAGRKG